VVDAQAGDHTALHKGFGSYPLRVLAPLGFAAGLLGLLAARLFDASRPSSALTARA
jgi:hypothetical protein